MSTYSSAFTLRGASSSLSPRSRVAALTLFMIIILALLAGCSGGGDSPREGGGKGDEVRAGDSPESRAAVDEDTFVVPPPKAPPREFREDGKVWIERWKEESPLNVKRGGLAGVSLGSYIYAIGGGEDKLGKLVSYDTVEYAKVLPDGSLGKWRETTPINGSRIYMAATTYGGYIYVMGGERIEGEYESGKEELIDTIERGVVNPDGTIKEWIVEEERMFTPRRGGQLYAKDGWLYASGGFNGAFLASSERAKINDDGTLGEWIMDKSTEEVRYISGYTESGGKLYVFGGHILSDAMSTPSVEVSGIRSDGSLAGWHETTGMKTSRFLNTVATIDNIIFNVGGTNTITLSNVERSYVVDDGLLSEWESETPMNEQRWGTVAVSNGSRIYVLGGFKANTETGTPELIGGVESATYIPGRNLGHFVEEGSLAYDDYKVWQSEMPLDSRLHLEKAKVRYRDGDFKKAVYETEEAIKVHPRNDEAYYFQGTVHYKNGDVKLAIRALERSVAIKGDNLKALIGLGNMNFDLGRYEKAVDHYKAALEVDHESVLAHENLGNAYLKLGKKKLAEAEFNWVFKGGMTPEGEGR